MARRGKRREKVVPYMRTSSAANVGADPLLDRAGNGADSDNDDEEGASRSTKASTRERKPAMAGAGKRGDMDDEIPF
jgi:hypothetical protein